MAFRLVSPGVPVAFPKLCVLALGNFVFSQPWQVNWITNLIEAGLEELYPDDCPVLWHAYTYVPSSHRFGRLPRPLFLALGLLLHRLRRIIRLFKRSALALINGKVDRAQRHAVIDVFE